MCGECCRHIDRVPMLNNFHNGTGVCKYLDRYTNLCCIYDRRPTICNISKAYDMYFSYEYTEREFLQLNYDACRELQKERVRGSMYLSTLSEEQKNLFLDLCIHIMNADNVVVKNEEIMLKQYCREMNLKMRANPTCKDVNIILTKLENISTKIELKKMTIEIIALIYADEQFEEEENKILFNIAKIFQLSPHVMGELVFVTRHLLLSYKLMNKVLEDG